MKMRKMRLSVVLILLLSLLVPVLAGCSDDRADREKEAEMLRLWEDTVVNGNGVGSIECVAYKRLSPGSAVMYDIPECLTIETPDDIRQVLAVLSASAVTFETPKKDKDKTAEEKEEEKLRWMKWMIRDQFVSTVVIKGTDGQDLLRVEMLEGGYAGIYEEKPGTEHKAYNLKFNMTFEATNDTVLENLKNCYNEIKSGYSEKTA